jgi:hypothetical protein
MTGAMLVPDKVTQEVHRDEQHAQYNAETGYRL